SSRRNGSPVSLHSFPTRRSSDLNLGISLVPLAEELTAVVVRAAILNQVAGMVVNDTNAPIPGVTVDILGLNRKISTNEEGRFLLDRKSTRLNSSHVKIPYADFCL